MNDLQPFTFRHALHLDRVERAIEGKAKVRFTVIDSSILSHQNGVCCVRVNDFIVYVGMYSNGFVKRWLYARGEYVYHFKHPLIAKEIDAHHKVDVFAESEETLKAQIGRADDFWINASGIEAALIRKYNPVWNRIAQSKRAGADSFSSSP